MRFMIEQGVEMPTQKRKSKYQDIPFSDMRVGDSVLLKKCNRSTAKSVYKTVYSGVYKVLRKTKGKYKIGVLSSSEDSRVEIRLWRVE